MKSQIQVDGESVDVVIKSMKRKTLRLAVTTDGIVEVRVPNRCPRYELEAFLTQHNDWIKERLEQVKQVKQRASTEFHYLGQQYTVQRASGINKLLLKDAHCFVPEHWDDAKFEMQKDRWLRDAAREYFSLQIQRWWPKFEVGAHIGYPTLRIKNMRTRWGSLSSRGYINLNLKLMHLEEDLIEMVIVHELCHSHHLDHGPNFYHLMEKHLPHYRQLEQRLRRIEKGVSL